MKTFWAITRWGVVLTIGVAVAAAVDSKTSGPSEGERLGAEQARSAFYKLKAQAAAAREQASTLDKQADASAADFNAKFKAMADKCESKQLDDASLTCVPPAPKKDEAKK